MGDAIAWPFEDRAKRSRTPAMPPLSEIEFRFVLWGRWSGGMRGFLEPVKPGEYSDDCQLMISCARSLVSVGPRAHEAFARRELPLWLVYARGAGLATRAAAKSWDDGVPPWRQSLASERTKYWSSGGNGVLMRVLPFALTGADFNEVAALVMANGVTTHGHPRALLPALALTYAVCKLLDSHGPLNYAALVTLLEESLVWAELPDISEQWPDWHVAFEGEYESYNGVWDDVSNEILIGLDSIRGELAKGALANDTEILERLGAFGQYKGSGVVTLLSAIYLASRYAVDPTKLFSSARSFKNFDADTVAAVGGWPFRGCAWDGMAIPLSN